MRRRGVPGPSTTEAQILEPPVLCWAMKRARSAFLWAGLLLLGALVSACGSSLEERAGSGAAAGGITGLALHDVKTNGAHEPTGVVLRQLLREQARLWDWRGPDLSSPPW